MSSRLWLLTSLPYPAPAAETGTGRLELADAGQERAGEELEGALEVPADLGQVDVVEPGVGVGPDRLDVRFGIRSGRGGHHVVGHQVAELAEVPGKRQQLARLAGQVVAGPQPPHGGAGLVRVGAPAHLEAALHRPVAAAAVAVETDQVLVRAHADEAVADARGQPRGLLPASGHVDGRRYPL